jgi:hypothetical protein
MSTSKIDVFLSALTAFAIVAGGSLVTVIASQPAGTGALNKSAWILSAVLGLVAAAKDARSLLKLPPLSPAALTAAAKATVAIAALVLLVGCQNGPPLITPAALTKDVSLGIRIGLDVSPSSAPDIATARDMICWSASITNTDPAAIVAWLQGAGITNTESKLIVDGAIFIYEKAWTAIGTNTTDQIEPYLVALCAGFTQALPPPVVTYKMSQQILPPHLK